jgi:hypothetical protein
VSEGTFAEGASFSQKDPFLLNLIGGSLVFDKTSLG